MVGKLWKENSKETPMQTRSKPYEQYGKETLVGRPDANPKRGQDRAARRDRRPLDIQTRIESEANSKKVRSETETNPQ